MSRISAFLLFNALLLPPAALSAQTPTLAGTAPRKVSLQVAFVTVKTDDLDALGINFDFLPVPRASATYLRGATDSRASYIYRMLTKTPAHADTYVFSLLPHKVSDNVAAIFTLDAEVPAPAASSAAPVQRDEKVTLIPQVAPGNSVKLTMLSPLSHAQRMFLYTVPSGQQIVINAAVVKVQPTTGRGFIEGGSGQNKASRTTELLIFITPTIVSETSTPAPAVKPQATAQPQPQAQLSGGAADFPSGSFGFGTGFGPTRPSDVLRSVHWLSSLHWPGESNINGTIGGPNPVIEAPPLPGEVKRVYAL